MFIANHLSSDRRALFILQITISFKHNCISQICFRVWTGPDAKHPASVTQVSWRKCSVVVLPAGMVVWRFFPRYPKKNARVQQLYFFQVYPEISTTLETQHSENVEDVLQVRYFSLLLWTPTRSTTANLERKALPKNMLSSLLHKCPNPVVCVFPVVLINIRNGIRMHLWQ